MEFRRFLFCFPLGPHGVERAPQLGHRGACRCPLLLAAGVLGLLRSVYRARTRRVRSPPQTARRGLEEAKPEGDRLTPPTASMLWFSPVVDRRLEAGIVRGR